MNILRIEELLNNNQLTIKSVSKSAPDSWKQGQGMNEIPLQVTNAKDIPQTGQFGFSVKATIDGVPYFIKLPPANEDSKTESDYYLEMQERFSSEFSKHEIFDHVIERCRDTFANLPIQFHIAKPLALCEVRALPGQPDGIPAIIYEYAGESDLSSGQIFKAETAADFLAFAKALARVVQLVHNQGILHSFIVPRNIIRASKNKYVLVGFGYSSFCDSKPNAIRHKVSDYDGRYRAPECSNWADNLGALWYPADIYSVGAILYSYATGNPMWNKDEIPRDVDRLKEKIYVTLKEAKGPLGQAPDVNLFTQNENILKILDKCLRYNPEDRFSCMEELIDTLEIAINATGSRQIGVDEEKKDAERNDRKQTSQVAEEISKGLIWIARNETPDALKTEELNPLFNSLLGTTGQNAVEDAKRMARGHHEVYGHRDVIITSLCRLLGGAVAGDLYRTITMPSYWTDGNLGCNGRFLTMNKHMARMGLRIERLFLVTQDFHELSEREQEILEFQLQAQRDVNDFLEREIENGRKPEGKFDIKVHKLESLERLITFEADARQVAYLQSGKEQRLCLNFVSQGHFEWLNGRKIIERRIKKVRYWVPTGFRKHSFIENLVDFTGLWESGALNLEAYIGDRYVGGSFKDLLARGKPTPPANGRGVEAL